MFKKELVKIKLLCFQFIFWLKKILSGLVIMPGSGVQGQRILLKVLFNDYHD